MYHAHRYSRGAWAGEPEIDPALDYEGREEIEGWELTPLECLDLAYGGVLRERFVEAGKFFLCVVGPPRNYCGSEDECFYLLGSSTGCVINLNASSGVLRAAK